MSQVIIFIIRAYQVTFSPFLHTAFGPMAGCRYELSCSEYAIQAFRHFGVIRGSTKSIRRVLSCHP